MSEGKKITQNWLCPICGADIKVEYNINDVNKITLDDLLKIQEAINIVVSHIVKHVMDIQHHSMLSRLFNASNMVVYNWMPILFDSIKPRQHIFELAWTYNNAEELNPKNIIEIGSWEGGTLLFWERLLKNGGHLIAIDPDPKPIFYERYNDKKIKELEEKGIYFHFIKGKSLDPETIKEIRRILGDKNTDFIFVDGDHMIMREDFMAYFPLLRDGGGIALHDFKIWARDFSADFYSLPFKKDVIYSDLLPPTTNSYLGQNMMWGTAFVWKERKT